MMIILFIYPEMPLSADFMRNWRLIADSKFSFKSRCLSTVIKFSFD